MQISDNSFAVSSIEFDKVYRVMNKRLALGFSDRELSFLLGYRALYVRDVENPLHTLRYTPKDTNFLLQIFSCKLKEIMAPKISQEFYQVLVKENEGRNGVKGYHIYLPSKHKVDLYISLPVEPVVFSSSATIEQVKVYINHLFSSDYFLEPRTALEIYQKCVKRFGKPLQPEFVADALKFHTSKRKAPKLSFEKNDNSRTVYKKLI